MITWRTPLFYRIFFPLVGLYFLYATVAYFDGGSDLLFTGLGTLLGVGFTVGPFRPLVRLGPSDVHARGLVFARRMPLQDIVDITGGYNGLTFFLRDGSGFEATAVGETSNISVWAGRRGKADSMADIILSARDQLIDRLPDEVRAREEVSAPQPASPVPACVNVALYVGTAVVFAGFLLVVFTDTWKLAGVVLWAVGTLAPVALRLWARNHP